MTDNGPENIPTKVDELEEVNKTSQEDTNEDASKTNDVSKEEKKCTCAFKESATPQDEKESQQSENSNAHESECPLSCESLAISDPVEVDEEEPILLDDLVDEEALKEEETVLTEEDFVARLDKAKIYKNQGNIEFAEMKFRDAILTYTKGLLICPLREKELRSILYANRGASKIKMGRNELAIEDCTKSLEYNPDYFRVLLRRAKLYQEADKLDEALADFQKVYELDPSSKEARIAIQTLPPQIHEKNEKLKEEMMGKLKDLGNMILKPFGLSTDNFKLQQDPNSGGYSINFAK